MSRCSVCDSTVTRKQSVFCNGTCQSIFHFDCVNIPSEVVQHLSSVPGLTWKCPTCKSSESKIDDKKFYEVLEKHCIQLFSRFEFQFEELKQEFIKSAKDQLTEISQAKSSKNSQITSYAESVATQQKVIVKPKNTEQQNSRTKSDLLLAIDPLKEDVKINSVKHIRDGGLLVGCSKSDSATKLVNAVEKKLSSEYDIHVVKTTSPQLRVVGMSEELDAETIRNYLLKQNDDLFTSDSVCKILSVGPTKKKKNIFQAVLQVDMLSYASILNRGNLIIGFDCCSVYEAIKLPRCFNCNGYFHSQKYCKSTLSCPICSEKHTVKDCHSNLHSCINCLNLKNSRKLDISTNHAAWDYEQCFAYKKAMEKFKFNLFGTSDI